MQKGILLALGLGIPGAVHAVVMDFNHLPPEAGDGTVGRGTIYMEDGFRLDNLSNPGGNPAFGEFKSIHSTNFRYSGSVSFYNNIQLGITQLSQVGGGAFDLVSIEIDGLNGTNPPYSQPAMFVFTGYKVGGGTVSQTFITDFIFPQKQTATFNSTFKNLSRVTWDQDNGFPRPSQQFDTIVVNAVPEPATLAVLGTALVALARRRKG